MPEEKCPLKVFLSHAHSDAKAVRALYDRLSADGVDAWLDKEKLLPGQDWELEIRKAVREADVVVVCLSKQFNQAGYRQKEVRIALDTAMEQPEGEIFIIPARLEECDTLESLRKWHWVDLFEEAGYEMLMRALRARADLVGAILQIGRSKPKVKKPRETAVPKKNAKSSQEMRMFYDLASHYECDIENTSAETLASFLLESLTRIMRSVTITNKSDNNRTVEYRTDQVEYFAPKNGKTIQHALIVHGKKLQLVGKGDLRGVESLTTVSEMLIVTVTQGIDSSRLRFDSNNIPYEAFKELVEWILGDFGMNISAEKKSALHEQVPMSEQYTRESKTLELQGKQPSSGDYIADMSSGSEIIVESEHITSGHQEMSKIKVLVTRLPELRKYMSFIKPYLQKKMTPRMVAFLIILGIIIIIGLVLFEMA
jgi:hypothetical protein